MITEIYNQHTRCYVITCLLFIIFIILVPFQKIKASYDKQSSGFNDSDPVKKYWTIKADEQRPEEWQANWIWQKEDNTGGSVVLLSRKHFNIETKPEKAMLFITADSFYEVYINGIFINRGPARCAPHHQSYDILDIAPVLKEGKNIIALRLSYKGKDGLNVSANSRPGFLVQLEIQEGSKKTVISTDSSWKVKGADWINIYTGSFGELTDFRKEVRRWKEADFDDSVWEDAKLLLTDMFWPDPSPGEKPHTIVFPWLSLVPRDIPYLNELTIKADQIFETGEIMELSYNVPIASGANGLIYPKEKNPISGLELYKQAKGPITIINNYPSGIFNGDGIYSSYLVFDLRELMHGYPVLEIEGEAGSIIELIYAPHLLRGKFPLRTDINKRPMTDRIILGKGKTTWEAIEMRDLRYLLVAVRNTEKPVYLHFAGMIKADYPFKAEGPFSVAKDDELEWLYTASLNTLKAISTDAYVDNYREKLQYAQTSYYASRTSYAAFGDQYLQRRYLVQIAQEQQNDGFLPVAAPKGVNNVGGFLDGSIFWLMGLHDYFLHTGDLQTLNILLPAAERFINLMRNWESSDGLIYSPPYSYWIDHAALDRSGANFCFNALYILVMQDYMNILRWTQHDAEAVSFEKSINKLRLTMRKKLWDSDMKLFSDALVGEKLSGTFSEQSNSLAIVAGIADPEQEKEIVKEFVENKSARLVPSVLFMHYVVESLFMSGYGKEALSMMKDRYIHMKEMGSETIWEEWSITVSKRTGEFEPNNRRAYVQGENTFPASSLTRWIVGIKPSKPGMTEVILSCNLCGLTEIKGFMPSPFGNIYVAWITDKKGLILETDVPDGMVVKVDLKGEDLKEKKVLSVDGQNIIIKTLPANLYTIPNGRHTLKLN